MRDYAKVSPKMWHGKTAKELRKRGYEALLVGLYLMTSPSSNMLGLFGQPVLYMAHETGLGIEGAMKGLQGCIEAGFCSYDEESEFVFVFEMARYQIDSELSPKDLRCKGVQKEYDGLSDNPFLGAFYDRYAAAFHMISRRGLEVVNATTSQAPCKPLPSQEQEQEQEQEQKSSSLRSEEGAGKPASTRPKRDDKTLKTYLATCKTAGMKPLPADHPIREYCRDAGISDEMLQVAWVVFRDEYTTIATKKDKRYKDWPGHFANAVRGGWAKLWYTDSEGKVAWSSRGMQEKVVLDARHKAKELVHEPA